MESGMGRGMWLIAQMGAAIFLVCKAFGHGEAICKWLRIPTVEHHFSTLARRQAYASTLFLSSVLVSPPLTLAKEFWALALSSYLDLLVIFTEGHCVLKPKAVLLLGSRLPRVLESIDRRLGGSNWCACHQRGKRRVPTGVYCCHPPPLLF